jgi:GntR family transcriptional regulator, transcriptional repressor for pyruvate dehydrogenase complex
LLEAIRSQTYKIGDRLPSERQLASEFGVSRPVVREALRMLSMLQVIEVQVGRGAFVTADPDVETLSDLNTPRDLLDILDVREIVETGALRLAHSRATPADRQLVAGAIEDLQHAVSKKEETAELDVALHRAIISASGSEILLDFWTRLENEIRRTVRVSPSGRSMSPEVLREHETLASGITEGRLDEAIEAETRLSLDNRAFLVDLIENEQDGAAAPAGA